MTVNATGPFSFPTQLSAGTSYSVVVAAGPANPSQNCIVSSGSGKMGSSAVTSVLVSCVANSSPIALTPQLLDLASSALGAVVPDTSRHRIYIAAPARNEVIVLDADTYLVIDHYFVGASPLAMALSADSGKLYVGLSQGGALVVVDLQTNAMTTIPVAIALGTPLVQALIEVRPGVVLVGGSTVGWVPTNLIAVDVGAGGTTSTVAQGLIVTVVTSLVQSPNGKAVYGVGLGSSPSSPRPPVLFSLDATKPSLPPIATTTQVNTVSGIPNVAVNEDGTRLLLDDGTVYDAASLQRLQAGGMASGVGETPGATTIMLAEAGPVLAQLDPLTLSNAALYNPGCPQQQIGRPIAAQLRGEWLLQIGGGSQFCAVSTSNPAVAPGVPGSRALPTRVPNPVMVPWAEIPDGYTNDIAFDNPRGLVYTANGFNASVDTFSLATQTVIGSIPTGGKPQVVALSADGNTLYAGLFDTGDLVTIDLPSQTITTRTNLTALLGTANIFRIVEIAPGHVLISSIPSLGGIGPNTYLVDIAVSNPAAASRVGCTTGYAGIAPVVSPDHHYLYLISATSCPPEKRDLTVPGYPVVLSGPIGGYIGGNGQPTISPDGARIFSGPIVIDTSTMQQVANIGGGLTLPSKNPDIFYSVGEQTIQTIELHDLRILATSQNGCQSTLDAVDNAAISADERTVISVGNGYSSAGVAGELCITQIAP
ncbi:MAG: hypothetical protein JSS86_00190 [Cyanobacteria bacterium SZAS LIN-2]|nr:hypothetical protein [Cyanobacteria bacterium SZAS LIN-2]